MGTKSKKLGPVSAAERRDYCARVGSDAKWRRPAEKTARAVWVLMEEWQPVPLEALMPKVRTRLSGEAYDQAALVGQQSLVVALDCAIAAGDHVKMLTFNRLLDSLATRWSISFRRARRKGARTVYDVREATAKAIWRELLVAGVRIDTLWKILAGRGLSEASIRSTP
jgi:hypothetical protein